MADSNGIDKLSLLKMIFGFVLLAGTFVIAGVVALGRVEEHTSYGLPYILGAIATLSGGFAQWAFGAVTKSKPDA